MPVNDLSCNRRIFVCLVYVAVLLGGIGLCTSIVVLHLALACLVLASFFRTEWWVSAFSLPGFWLACAYAVLQIVAHIVAAPGDRFAPPGGSYAWIIMYLLALALAEVSSRRWFVRAVFAGGMLAVGLGLLQFFVGLDDRQPPFRISAAGEHFTRACGWFSHHIRFGTAMVTLALISQLPPAVAVLPLWCRWVMVGLAWIGVVISSARGQLLALVAGVMTWAMCAERKIRWWALGCGLVGSTLAMVGLWLFSGHRVLAAAQGHDVRWEVWKLTLRVITEHPWLGVGSGGLSPAIQALAVRENILVSDPWVLDPGHAHNTFLSVAVCYGLPALIVYVGWLFCIVRSLWIAGGVARQLGFAVCAAFVVGGMTEDLGGLATSRYAFFIGIALAWSLRGWEKRALSSEAGGLPIKP